MSRTRNVGALLTAVSVMAFAIGAWAPEAARAVSGAVVAPAVAQDPVQQQQEPPDPAAGRGGRGQAATGPRPYASVITAAAKTDDGIFKVHRVNDQLYYEIPKSGARQGLPLGHADQADGGWRRLPAGRRLATGLCGGSLAVTASC